MTWSDLPAVNAGFNTLSTLLLAAGYVFIRRGNRTAHRRCMVAAMGTSILFLTTYLVYHSQTGRTVFRDPDWFRPVYLTVLLTHTVLAMLIVPLVIGTAVRALRGQFEQHREVGRRPRRCCAAIKATDATVAVVHRTRVAEGVRTARVERVDQSVCPAVDAIP